MKRMLQTVSRGALITMLAATPVLAYAQTDDSAATVDTEIKQNADQGAAVESTTEGSADVAADEGATDDTMAPAEDVATDEAAPVEEETDMATDEAAPVEDDTDLATDETQPAQDGMTAAPATDVATDDGAMVEESEQMAAEEPAKPVEGQITMQDADTVLAEDLLGATVYNGSDENVGDINDLIIGLDGSVKGVVIGVGGFLGLGEKDVAVEMAALDVIDNEGTPRLVTSASKSDLEAAPTFVTAADQAAAQQQTDMQSSGDTMGGTMGGTAQPTE